MCKIKLNAIYSQLFKMIKKISSSGDDALVYTDKKYNHVVYIEVDKICNVEAGITTGTRVVIKCPHCSILMSTNYDSLYGFNATGKNFCYNRDCKYFSSGRKIGLFEVLKLCTLGNQTFITGVYENCHQKVEFKCNLCNNIRNITFSQFTHDTLCNDASCENVYRKFDD